MKDTLFISGKVAIQPEDKTMGIFVNTGDGQFIHKCTLPLEEDSGIIPIPKDNLILFDTKNFMCMYNTGWKGVKDFIFSEELLYTVDKKNEKISFTYVDAEVRKGEVYFGDEYGNTAKANREGFTIT